MGLDGVAASRFGEEQGGEVGVDHRTAVVDEALPGIEAAQAEIAGIMIIAARLLQIVDILAQLHPVDVSVLIHLLVRVDSFFCFYSVTWLVYNVNSPGWN